MPSVAPSLAVAAVVAAGFAAAYAGFRPSVQHQGWDSLGYARAAETGGIRGAIMGNHPLGHVGQNAVFVALRRLGYPGRALPVLAALNGLCAALAVAGVFWLARARMSNGWSDALGLAALLGGSVVSWRFAATADIYAFALLTAVVAWAAVFWAVAASGPRPWTVAGLAAGAAFLAHQLNGLLLPVGIALALLNGGRCAVGRIALLLAAAGVTIVLGGWWLGWLATGHASPLHAWAWMAGYLDGAGESSFGRYFSFAFVREAAAEFAGAFAPKGWNGRTRLAQAVLVGGALIVLCWSAVCAWWAAPADGRRRCVQCVALGQSALTWLLALWWEPWNPKYYLFALYPLAFAVAAGLGAHAAGPPTASAISWPQRGLALVRAALVPVLAAMLVAYNLAMVAAPQRSETPAFRAGMDAWLQHSTPDDLLLTSGDLVPHLRFWAGRPKAARLALYVMPGGGASAGVERLRSAIETELAAGHRVLVAANAADFLAGKVLDHVGGGGTVDRARELLASYRREPAFTYVNDLDGAETVIYRLHRATRPG